MFLLVSAAHAGVTVTVTVDGIRPDTGLVGCTLFRQADGFPEDDARAAALQVARPTGGSAVCTFADVPEGTLAVAVIHDLDGDLKLDRNLFGKPTEGYGFSNGAKASMFSAPPFDTAAVKVDADADLRVTLAY